jgi:MoaA/NifB/PqqE/SkfB family radical SAM enzyme
MTRVLCLGNNSEDTDCQTRILAQQNQTVCHGLLSELDRPFSELDYSQPGYYHSTVVDLQLGNLKKVMQEVDQVIMLDQPVDQWNHSHEFVNTVRLMKSTSTPVQFMNPEEIKPAEFFLDLVESNKSFCIFPFIEFYTAYHHTHLCCYSDRPVKKLEDLQDFAQDEHYQQIRQSMLQGKQLPDYCKSCYDIEAQGIISPRIAENLEWVYRLGIKNLDDLRKIKKPAFYDIRPSNKCNLTCRTCQPEDSHLIDREYQELKIHRKRPDHLASIDFSRHESGTFDLVDFDNIQRLLVAGGEPTIMPEFFDFLQKCIDTQHTDFEINVTTNGTNLSERLKSLSSHFQDFSWVFSIDGYQDLNHYIRHPSDWSSIIDNWRYHVSEKNVVTVNTTISIYNVDSLHVLFEFIDQEFPNTYVNTVVLTKPGYLSPLLFPDPAAALESLRLAQQTHCYQNSSITQTNIDYLVRQFQNHQANPHKLKQFYHFNDLLDQHRNIRLADHVPVLETHRHRYAS